MTKISQRDQTGAASGQSRTSREAPSARRQIIREMRRHPRLHAVMLMQCRVSALTAD